MNVSNKKDSFCYISHAWGLGHLRYDTSLLRFICVSDLELWKFCFPLFIFYETNKKNHGSTLLMIRFAIMKLYACCNYCKPVSVITN